MLIISCILEVNNYREISTYGTWYNGINKLNMGHKIKEKSMNILVDLFVTFLKIGTFTVGGGPSMIPLIERDAVYNKKWISKVLDLL